MATVNLPRQKSERHPIDMLNGHAEFKLLEPCLPYSGVVSQKFIVRVARGT